MFLRPPHNKPCRLSLFAAAAVLSASPCEAQLRSASVEPDAVDAGSLQTMRYVFVAGQRFSKGGGIRIELPVGYSETESVLWSPPQADHPSLPGYVWATVSSRARVTIKIEGLLRGIVEATFLDDVPPAATIAIFYRGQVQSVAGEIDARFATKVREAESWIVGRDFPRVTIRPAAAQLVKVHYPSDVIRDQPFDLSIAALDKYGNLATGFAGAIELKSTDSAALFPSTVTLRPADRGRLTVPGVVFRTEGFQKITAAAPSGTVTVAFKYAWVSDRDPQTRHLFGDLHFHTGTGAANRSFFTGQNKTDVNTTATNTFKELNLAGDHRANFTRAGDAYEYARDVMGLDFASTSEHDAPVFTPEVWSQSQDVSDSFNVPGKFTTFYGFEWTPDLDHYVVLYNDRSGRVFDHVRYPDYPSLFRALDSQNVPVLTIPHVSWPFRNHVIWHDSVSARYRRIGEIYSLWNSRHLVQPDDDPQLFELSPDDAWSYQHAWKRGFRIGVVGASDNHLGHPGANSHSVYVRHSGGLAVAVAKTNDRKEIWSSMLNRTVYATTGTHIYLDFSADDHAMGSEYTAASSPRFEARIAGTNQLASVELIKLANGEFSTVFEINPRAETYVLDFTDRGFTAPSMYYLRIRQVDEYPDRLYAHSTAEMAWSSPIWIERQSR